MYYFSSFRTFLIPSRFIFCFPVTVFFEVWMSFPVPSVWIITRGGMEAIEISTTPITTARKRPRSFSISNFRLVRSWCRFRSGSAWKQPPSSRKMDLTKVLEATVSPGNFYNDGSNLSGKNSWKTPAERSTWPRSCMMFVSSFKYKWVNFVFVWSCRSKWVASSSNLSGTSCSSKSGEF